MSKLPKTTVALIVSMIANALLVGYIASSLVTRPPLPPRPMPFDRMESALSHVSPQYQDDIQNLIDEHKGEFERRIKGMPPPLQRKLDTAMQAAFERDKDLRKQIDDKRQEIAGIMKAEPFDAATFKTKNEELFTLLGQAGRSMAAAVSEVAEDAPPEQRADIARMLLKGPGAGAPGALRHDRGQPRNSERHGGPGPKDTGNRPSSYMPPAEYEEAPSQDNADDELLPDHP